MSTLVLTKMWLNRMDTGEAISGYSGRDRATAYAIDGEVRTYASGRRRAVTVAGLKGTVSRTFAPIDKATADKLVTWLGVSVQLRDHRGGRWFGVFLDVQVSEYMDTALYAAAVTVETTTTVEGV